MSVLEWFYRLKRLEDALFIFEEAIGKFRNCAAAYSGKGDLLFDLDKLWEALQSYTEAIVVSPGFVSAYVGKEKYFAVLSNMKKP